MSEITQISPPSLIYNIYPRVSIITAVFNGERYINECITSVLSQTYTNFEYIIIDGGSTDNTVDIIKCYQDKLAYWVSEPDQGIYDAWNKGLAVAKGQWIAFIGADDILYNNALHTYIEHIDNHPNGKSLEFISSQIQLVKPDLSLIRTVGEPWQWNKFKINMITWHVGAFHSSLLFSKYGQFDSFYKSAGDYELLLRPKAQLIASYIPEVTVKMRIGGISDRQLYKAIQETYHAKIKNGIVSPLYGKIFTFIDKTRVYLRSHLKNLD